MENRLLIAGEVLDAPTRRVSPAGIPILRFKLRHRSRQYEAGAERQITCELPVVAVGEELAAVAMRLQPGERIRISGFLSRADHRSEYRTELHAGRIERVGSEHE